MSVNNCIPIVPSLDVERSLRFWRDGLGFAETWWEQRAEGKLIGCGIRKNHMMFMFNPPADNAARPADREGIRFYWAPDDLPGLRAHLLRLGYGASEIEDRDYGQTEFFVTDDDGFEHCFGVATPTSE